MEMESVGRLRVKELTFQYSPFWVNFHDLPLVGFSKNKAIMLGNMAAGWTAWTQIRMGKTLWVHVRLDVTQPLRRG
ncbi:unnamed protein product [Citrullus colocynthis]|uniref:DUF4283 domain-containing protein n=1 Tax=Citrullus colocynthis TaxID=252529 RepID=A0ABP0YPM6_9ROSI